MRKFTDGVEPTGAGEFDFMSTDPNSGIAFITMFDSTNGTLTNGEQFSGVLISPDEILTVAHGVTNDDGTLRNYGTAYLGYNGGVLTGGDAITSVHVIDGSHPSGGRQTDSQIAKDYAVIHLATPVTSAQVFALGTGTSGGTYTVAGYPAVDAGRLVSTTEALTVDDGVLTGTSLVPNGSAEGASGGAVYTVDNGTPTVRGLDVAEDGAGHAFMMGLSQSQIDQIKAWVSSDDAGQTWALGGSGTTPAPVTTSPTPTVTPTPVTNVPSHVVTPKPIDHLERLVAQLDSSAAYTYGPRSQIIAAVATSLTQARHEGLSTSNLPELASEAANLLQKTSSSPNRATAYMAGIMASESGITRNRIFGYIANVFGIELGNTQQIRQLALAGFREDKLLGLATTAAPITMAATSVYELADTISRSYDGVGHIGYTKSEITSTPSLVAPHTTHGIV